MNTLNLLILLPLMMTSCSMLDRRDYSDKMSAFMEEGPMFKANDDFMVVAGDSGRDYRSQSAMDSRTPFGEKNELYRLEDQSLRSELIHLENSLSDHEYSKYTGIRDDFKQDSEKIYYLSLSSRQREDYLEARKIAPENTAHYANYRTPIVRANGASRAPAYIPSESDSTHVMPSSAEQVSLGMGMDDVADLLGAPERRDIAGNPDQMNERWAYRSGQMTKYIYFESGRVEGWESESSQF